MIGIFALFLDRCVGGDVVKCYVAHGLLSRDWCVKRYAIICYVVHVLSLDWHVEQCVMWYMCCL